MARELTFKIKKKEYTATPLKVDRRKLYGWTQIIALDDNGDPCNLVTTDEAGQFIIEKGGTGLGILTPSGEWADRSQLKYVNEDGTKAELIKSSYNVVNPLKEKVSLEEFLDYSITDFYELTELDSDFIKEIGEDIYRFTYSYLDNFEGTPAFIMNSFGSVFMLIGVLNKFELLCFGDCSDMDHNEDYNFELETDDLDFSMFL